MKKNDIFEWIDNADLTELEQVNDERVKEIIRLNRDLKVYYELTLNLRKASPQKTEVDLRKKFEERLNNRRIAPFAGGVRWKRVASLGFITALIIVVGVIFYPFREDKTRSVAERQIYYDSQSIMFDPLSEYGEYALNDLNSENEVEIYQDRVLDYYYMLATGTL